MTAALVTLGLLVIATAVLGLVGAGAVEGTEPVLPRTGRRPQVRRRSLHGVVVFAHREGSQDIGLDCLVEGGVRTNDEARDGGSLDPGAVMHPVHLRAAGTYLWGLGTGLADMVAGWVADGRQVPVEIVRDGHGRGRLRASTGTSVAVLEVSDFAELEHLLAGSRRAA